jgi:hypothetical protein
MPDEGQFRSQPFLRMSFFLLLAARGRLIARFTRCFVITFFVGHLFLPPVQFITPSTVLCFAPSFLLDFGCPGGPFSPAARTSPPPTITAKAGSEFPPQKEIESDLCFPCDIFDNVNPFPPELSKAEIIDASADDLVNPIGGQLAEPLRKAELGQREFFLFNDFSVVDCDYPHLRGRVEAG